MNKLLITFLFSILIIFILTIYLYNSKNSFKIKKYKKTSNLYELPKNIYCFWHDYENDDFIKLFIENWKRKCDWNIIVLHKNNVDDYTNGHMKKYNSLDNTKYSDFLRLYLLKEHGGVWMDISTIIINGNFLEEYRNEMIENKYDCLMYEIKTQNKQIQTHTESWFIMAPKNSILINEWFDVFDKAFDMGFIKFKKDILIPSGLDLSNTIGNNPEEIYLMIYACLHYLMFKGHRYNLLTKNAKESMIKFHIENDWNDLKIENEFCSNILVIDNNIKINNNNMYAIKLTRHDRSRLKNSEKCNLEQILKLI